MAGEQSASPSRSHNSLRVTPGRNIHYVMGDLSIRPAIVVYAHNDENIIANVFYNSFIDHGHAPCESQAMMYDGGESALGGQIYRPFTWHWPERV